MLLGSVHTMHPCTHAERPGQMQQAWLSRAAGKRMEGVGREQASSNATPALGHLQLLSESFAKGRKPASTPPQAMPIQASHAAQPILTTTNRLIRGGLLLNVRHEACGPPHVRPLLGRSHRRGVRQVLRREGGSSGRHENSGRHEKVCLAGATAEGCARCCGRRAAKQDGAWTCGYSLTVHP